MHYIAHLISCTGICVVCNDSWLVSPGSFGHGFSTKTKTVEIQNNLSCPLCVIHRHYSEVIKSAMVSQITGVSIVYSTICSGADQRKHHRSASLAFVRGIHRWPLDSPHKGPVTQKMLPFEDVIMQLAEMSHDSNGVLHIRVFRV